MSLRIRCPSCKAINRLDEEERGRRVRCEECDERISVPAQDDDDNDRPRRIKKKSSAGSSSNTLLLLLGGGVFLLFLICGVGGLVAIWMIKAAQGEIQQVAKANQEERKRRGANENFQLIAKGKVVLDHRGNLTRNDPPDPTPDLKDVNARMKVHGVSMKPGKTYVITMISDDFDAYLRVESPRGEGLQEDDDSAGDLNAQIVFQPAEAGMFRVIATSWDGGVGRYHLKVQETD
jgi:predicted Zn finger-like uncharacterized protein